MPNKEIETTFYEFLTSDEAMEWGRKHYGAWAEAYKRSETTLDNVLKGVVKSSAKFYSGYTYRQMNALLRGMGGEREVDEIYNVMNHTLALAISFAPRVPENIVVYRGVRRFFVEELKKAKKKYMKDPCNNHGWVSEKGFLSTSLISYIEMDHGYDDLLRIYLPKGTPGAYIPLIAGRAEHELLMLPNCFLKLKDENNSKLFKFSKEKINGYSVYDCDFTYMAHTP